MAAVPAPSPGPTGARIAAQTFTFRELERATGGFSEKNFIGEGGFGRVYKGWLESTGQVVAVKQLDRNGVQGNREFLVEVLMLSLLHHPNLVNLIGYCADGDQRLLVYEFMPRGALEDHLHDLPEGRASLEWSKRMRVAAGAAKGLEYLHEEASPPVIYRDFKSSNILLDENWHPKLSDFGLAKLGPVGDKTHVSTRVMGTYGYCAPEYAMTGQLTVKSDVYSFGVVLLELITGRKAIDSSRPHGEHNLVAWARPLFKDRRKFPAMADPLLQGRYPMRGLYQALAVAAMCLQEQASQRPMIHDVVTALNYLSSQPYDPNNNPQPRFSAARLGDARQAPHPFRRIVVNLLVIPASLTFLSTPPPSIPLNFSYCSMPGRYTPGTTPLHEKKGSRSPRVRNLQSPRASPQQQQQQHQHRQGDSGGSTRLLPLPLSFPLPPTSLFPLPPPFPLLPPLNLPTAARLADTRQARRPFMRRRGLARPACATCSPPAHRHNSSTSTSTDRGVPGGVFTSISSSIGPLAGASDVDESPRQHDEASSALPAASALPPSLIVACQSPSRRTAVLCDDSLRQQPLLQQVGLVRLHRRLLRLWLPIRALQWSPFRLPLSASPQKLSASANQLSPSAHELPASANHRNAERRTATASVRTVSAAASTAGVAPPSITAAPAGSFPTQPPNSLYPSPPLSTPLHPSPPHPTPLYLHFTRVRRTERQQRLSQRPVLQHPRLRMAYFVNWAGMDPSLIPSASLTHVFYAFALIDATTYQVVPSNPAVDVTQGLYLRFNSALKTANPAIKSLLSIGGYSAGTTTFTNAASSASSRSAFIQSAIHFARSYNFDCLDIDWEYPTGQTALFSALLTDFRAAIESEAASSGRPKLLLSAAVSAYEPTVTQAYDVPTLNKTLDLVNIMTYDLHGSWEAKTGMHTALEDLSNPQLSLKGAMAAWVSRGLDGSKAMLGLAMYGRTWTLASTSSTGVGAAATGPGLAGSVSQEAGVLFYREISQMVATGGYKATLHTPSSSMYAVKGNQWVGYDNPSTITTKVNYAKAQSFGGWFFWALNQDANNALLSAASAV
ncbi:unnamed protein product [Closterium sp. Naga37s-1]|nr:unnamed protein product [Closterium sp. Naga37s-1]